METKFIKQIRRIEIKNWIITLRALVKNEQNCFETTEDLEGYLDSEQFTTIANNIVAIRAKIKQLFKARNDFSVFEKLSNNKLKEIEDAVEDLRSYEKEYKEAEKKWGWLGVQIYDYALAAEYVAAENKLKKLYRSVIGA